MNVTHYTYRVTWSAEDSEHVGLCAEFPSLSWLAPTPEKALSGIRRVSRPGLRRYSSSSEAPRIRGGLGVSILSTPLGLL